MEIRKTGAKYSAIVGIGEQLGKIEKETGRRILRLNRGVPAVVDIDISEVIPLIDFSSSEILLYPPNSGLPGLKNAINKYYFNESINSDKLFVTAGGMNALDLVFKTLKVAEVAISTYYWGAYINLMKINGLEPSIYQSYDYLLKHADEYSGKAVIICDPNNPVGDKFSDEKLLETISALSKSGATVIWDSPYRTLFYEDNTAFFAELITNKNVIITESFSKSLGLSGQRLGFVYCGNQAFNEQFGINLLFATNGINGFAQVLVEKIFTTGQGQKAAKAFRTKTKEDIEKNITYLQENGFLADYFYRTSRPMGIFVVLNKSYEALLTHDIGTVSMSYFTQTDKESAQKYTRACISVPHNELKMYFDKLL